ncbi:response regulator [bacterium]|nr:response regulator [candidate division CSSED10-310 bacterium]
MMDHRIHEDAPTILFVEDEPNMRNLVEKVFIEKGYHILTAPHGIAAMEILVNTTPDLIVSDIMMPEMNGIELFKAVQERFGDNRPVFMFLTAKNDEDDIVSGFSLGVEDYITKPVSIRQLAVKIEARIKQIQAQKKTLTTGLRGNLKDQGIADIIQFIELAEHTGRLSIEFRGHEGQIQFRDGQIVWADFSPLSGLDAVYTLIALDSGAFYFDHTENIVKNDRIKASNYALILEAMKRIDEQGRDRILEPVLDKAHLFASTEANRLEVMTQMTDTVPMAVIPDPVFDGLSEQPVPAPESLKQSEPVLQNGVDRIGDTQRMRAVLGKQPGGKPESESNGNHVIEPVGETAAEPVLMSLPLIQMPDWVQSIDFEAIADRVSELENGDLFGRWVTEDKREEILNHFLVEPGCMVCAESAVMIRVFRVLSEMFFIPGSDNCAIPMIGFEASWNKTFRLIGIPWDRIDQIPREFRGVPSIILFTEETTSDDVNRLISAFRQSPAGSIVITGTLPDWDQNLKQWISEQTIPRVEGNMGTWLGLLIVLGKCLRSFTRP